MRNLSRAALKNLSLELENVRPVQPNNLEASAMWTLQLAVEFATSAGFVIATDPNGKTCRIVRQRDHVINLDGDKDTCYGKTEIVSCETTIDYTTQTGDMVYVKNKPIETDRGYKNTPVRKVFVPGITSQYFNGSYEIENNSKTVADSLYLAKSNGGDITTGVHRLVALAASWAGATQGCRDMKHNSYYWKFVLEDLVNLSLGEMINANLTQGLSYITAMQILMCQIAIEHICDRSTQGGAQAYNICTQIMLNDSVYDQAEMQELSRIAQTLVPMLFHIPGMGVLNYHVNHMDSSTDGNYPSNLEFVTPYDNGIHGKLMEKLRNSTTYNHMFNGWVCRYSLTAEIIAQFCGYFSQLPGSIIASPHWLQDQLMKDRITAAIYNYSNWNNTNIFVKQADGSYRKITVKEHEALEKLSSQDRATLFARQTPGAVRLQIINTLTDERDRNALMYCGNPKVITTTPPAGAQVHDALLIDECVTFAQALYGFAV